MTVAVLAIAAAPAVAQEAPPPQPAPVQAEPVEPAEPAAPAEPVKQAEPAEAPPRQGQLPPRTGRPGRTPRERPPARRPSSRLPGLFEGNRISRQNDPTRQELTLTANMLGGYDDNLTAGFGTGAGSVPETAASGSAQYADASLTFFRGNAARSILLGANGNLRMYPNYIERPAPGGAAVIEATTLLGQKQTLTVGERIGYEPMFNASSRVATVPTPGIDAIPVAGLFLRQSFNSTSMAAIDHRWTRRDSTRLAYSYGAQQFEGSYGDNSAHNVSAEYRRRLSRGLRLRAGYGYLDGEYTDYADATRPNLQHTVEGGPGDRDRAVPPAPPDLVLRGWSCLCRGGQLAQRPLPVLDSDRQRERDTGPYAKPGIWRADTGAVSRCSRASRATSTPPTAPKPRSGGW